MIMKNKITVYGDVILDEYWYGESTRLSPEFPVPVVDNVRKKYHVGGAGNVAVTCAVFSDDVWVYGAIGADLAGGRIEIILDDADVHASLSKYMTNESLHKIRVMSNDHQLCRVDSGEICQSLNTADIKQDGQSDVIIISDYGKGTLPDHLIRHIIKSNDCPVIVDPKGANWNKYKGAFCLTPNLKEFEEAVGNYSDYKALTAVKKYDLNGLLITKGSAGLTWVGARGDIINFSSNAREVFDVTGAGDAVIATFSAYLFEGIPEALRKANKAAGIVVGKLGTSLPLLEEVEDRVVFTNGCFDIIHSGHVALLEEARNLGTKLIVGLNSDTSVQQIKRKPINSVEDRKRVLESIQAVDEVIIFDEDTPYNLINELKPNVLVKGGDYTIETVVGSNLVSQVVIIPSVEGKSTSNVIERIKNNE